MTDPIWSTIIYVYLVVTKITDDDFVMQIKQIK